MCVVGNIIQQTFCILYVFDSFKARSTYSNIPKPITVTCVIDQRYSESNLFYLPGHCNLYNVI